MKRRPQSKQTNSDAIYGEIEIILPRKYVLQISWLVYHVETGFIFFFSFLHFSTLWATAAAAVVAIGVAALWLHCLRQNGINMEEDGIEPRRKRDANKYTEAAVKRAHSEKKHEAKLETA